MSLAGNLSCSLVKSMVPVGGIWGLIGRERNEVESVPEQGRAVDEEEKNYGRCCDDEDDGCFALHASSVRLHCEGARASYQLRLDRFINTQNPHFPLLFDDALFFHRANKLLF